MNTTRPLYKDPQAALAERIEDLLSRMTLEEKVAQITTVWEGKAWVVDAAMQVDPAKLKEKFPHGIGQLARPSDAKDQGAASVVDGRDAPQTVALVNAFQRWAMKDTRLGIPILMHEEGLHGYCAVGATSFPQAIALASAWDRELMRDINAVTAREMRARGVTVALTPVVDVARDPRWGRIEETFGEDPYLVAEMGVAAVQGLQGVRPQQQLEPGKVFATLKHLTGHGQPESGTNVGPAPYAERELREVFFPPFEAAIRRAGASAVMASYNEIDGVPSHANPWLLGDVLRGEWGFDGAVLADYYAIDQLHLLHHVAASYEEAALLALHAGVDSDLPQGKSFSTLADAVRAGRVKEAQIDVAVRRMLALKFRSGLFENPYASAEAAEQITNNAEARALALKAAQRSIVLLKNDGTLPLVLPPAGQAKPTIAVVGPNAATTRLGGYQGFPPHVVSILDGLRAKLGERADVIFAQGVKITESDDWWADEVRLADPKANRELIAQAVALARRADTIVLVLGDSEQTSREAWATHHLGDRATLDLVGEQQELFDALKALAKPIVVVLINGRPVSTVVMAEQANALIEGWYLGEQGGNAMADVLLGDVNPGGKLPLSVARHVGQLPLFYNHKPSARRGYLFESNEPLFPFGWGLSYASFEISAPRLSASSMGIGGSVQVMVDVRNTSARSGDETVQLYIRDKISSVTRPVKELKGFERVTLAAGEQRTVTFTLTPQSLQMWDARMRRVVEPGEFDIMAGANSQQLQTVMLTATASDSV